MEEPEEKSYCKGPLFGCKDPFGCKAAAGDPIWNLEHTGRRALLPLPRGGCRRGVTKFEPARKHTGKSTHVCLFFWQTHGLTNFRICSKTQVGAPTLSTPTSFFFFCLCTATKKYIKQSFLSLNSVGVLLSGYSEMRSVV